MSEKPVHYRRCRSWVFGAAALSLFVSSAAPASGQTVLRRTGVTNVPDQNSLAPFGISRHWVGQASFDPTSDSLSSITADEVAVYAVSRRGFVTAFDAETGNRLWAARLGAADRPVLEPSTNLSEVIFAVGRSLVALEKTSGNVNWKLDLEALPSAGPSADDQNVYIGFENGGVAAYDLRRIKTLYDDGKLPEYSYNALAWNYRTSKSVSSTPQSDGETVEFASRSGVFYSVTAYSRQLRFLVEGAGPITAPFTRTAKSAIVPCDDLNVYCIDATRGSVRWTLVTGLPVKKKPLVFGDRVFVSPGRTGTIAVSLDDGTRLWQQPRAAEMVASAGGRLYAKTTLGQLLTLDTANGNVIATLPVSGFEHHVVNERTDRIFLASSRGTVLCLRERDRDFPKFHLAPEREPLSPEFASETPAAAEPADAI